MEEQQEQLGGLAGWRTRGLGARMRTTRALRDRCMAQSFVEFHSIKHECQFQSFVIKFVPFPDVLEGSRRF